MTSASSFATIAPSVPRTEHGHECPCENHAARSVASHTRAAGAGGPVKQSNVVGVKDLIPRSWR
jgi:hypothetical protein